ncbi:MAG: hypothetical protein H8D96_00055 [Desulfobacterales bacterium]|uniref:Uncharacterized protein n=1 Tax=Candidatus Desulfatibia vada TaxID=2841696 RepID=A0A8J6NN97_9BACT|nr:hypothetical protein [Candidatus Desulfatibia vada]MBL6972200.1 hypothetical protein [Desulfobacterales bacterium]
MTNDTSYRLGRFEIIEKENGEIHWETHAGFGRLRTGKCFIEGEILFIGPHKTEELGFLKGEFIDHLNKFPKWEKTKYYCSSYSIYSCKTGRMSRNFGAGEDIGNKIKRINNLGGKEKFCEETIPEPVNLSKVISKFTEKGVVIWGLLKGRFL